MLFVCVLAATLIVAQASMTVEKSKSINYGPLSVDDGVVPSVIAYDYIIAPAEDVQMARYLRSALEEKPKQRFFPYYKGLGK